MTEPSGFNDLAAPEGYVFLADSERRLAHLSAADEASPLTLCRAPAGDFEAFTYLPHEFATCPACLRLADEASSRPD